MGAQAPSGSQRIDALGGAFIGLASLQFGGVVVLGKIVTDGGLDESSFLAIRFAACALLLGLALAAVRQPLAASRSERWQLAGLGLGGYAVEAWLFFAALKHGSAPAVTLLFFTYPVIVALLSVVVGKGLPGRLVIVALACSVAGAAIVVLTGAGLEITPAGVALSLASALTFSLYLMGADTVLEETNSLTGSMWVSAAAAVGLAVVASASSSGEWPVGLRQWVPVLGSAAFTAGAFVCLFAGLRRLGAVRASIVAASEPLSATLLAVIFLDQKLRASLVIGGLLILSGAVTASLARREPSVEPPVP